MGEPCVSEEGTREVTSDSPKPERPTEPAIDAQLPVKPVATPAAVVAKPTPAGAKPTPTAAAKKPPAPPDPRVEAARTIAKAIQAVLVDALGEAAVEVADAAHIKPMVLIRKSDWQDAVQLLKDHPDYLLDYVACMAGTDYPTYLEVVVYVQSTQTEHFVCLKTRTDRPEAEVPSLASIFPGVNWEEREIFDLLGVRFTDHPDLRRIMMPEDYSGHPLRKDFNPWD